MQGGVLECTELRESNRDPDEVGAALFAGSTWWFANQNDATFAEALTRLNFATAIDARLDPRCAEPSDTGSLLIVPPTTELVPTNHVTVRAARAGEEGAHLWSFPDAVREAESLGCCTVAAHLPLDDPARTPDRAWLARRGYTLTAISPPKRSSQLVAGTRHETISGPTGIWCAVRRDLTTVAPHYLQRTDLDPDETAVLEQLRGRLATLRAPA